MLSAKTLACVRSHIEDGVPLEDMKMTQDQRERVLVAKQVYERLRQDPMLDVMRCLRRTFGRSLKQARGDMEVVSMLVDTLDGVDRTIAEFRARKVAEGIVRIGQQTGDWKPMKAGLDKLIQIDRLDKPEESAENIGERTFSLPPVFVRVEAVDAKYQTVTEEQRAAIIRKYGGVEDENMALVKRKAVSIAASKPNGNTEECKEIQAWEE